YKFVYVDSFGGNDTNTGYNVNSPLQTLAAAKAAIISLNKNANLMLKRGSLWREELNLSLLSPLSVKVMAYGSGNPPIIDGTNIITSWTKTGGYTNIYQASITTDGASDDRVTVYENDVLLSRVTSMAILDSTPGAFLDANSTQGTSLTIYIQASDSGNPASNGRQYEISVRDKGIVCVLNQVVSGIQTQKVMNNNGNMDGVGIKNLNISNHLARYGTKHNLGIGTGIVVDSIAYDADPGPSYEPADAMYVAYLNSAAAGDTNTWNRCGAIYPGSSSSVESSLSHTADSTTFTASNNIQCWGVGATLTYGPPGGTATPFGNTSTGCYGKNVHTLDFCYGIANQCLCSLPAETSTVTDFEYATATDCAAYVGNHTGGSIYRTQGANIVATFTNCALVGPSVSGTCTRWHQSYSISGTSTLTINNTVFFNGQIHIDIEAGLGYVGDYNIFAADTLSYSEPFDCMYIGSFKQTLAAWQTATGQDQHSVYLVQSDQTSGNQYAFWLGTKLGTGGPINGDFRINPGARVYDGNDVAYIGTYPDSTPITNAGPQHHWDWNARALASGPPLAWPNVPTTYSDSINYVSNPLAWIF